MKSQFDFDTFYNMFFITSDGGNAIKTGWFDNINIKKYETDHLFEFENLVVIKTGSYGHIRGEINILNQESEITSFENYDHVVEGYLEVQSGNLRFLECPGSQLQYQIKIVPGDYRIRIYSANLTTTDIDEMEGDDYYKIEMWISTNKELKVLKQYTPPWLLEKE